MTVLTWQQCLAQKYKEDILANRLSCLYSTVRQQACVHYIYNYCGVRFCAVFQVYTLYLHCFLFSVFGCDLFFWYIRVSFI